VKFWLSKAQFCRSEARAFAVNFTPTTSARRDELWQHTCFEAFLRTPGADGYIEVNLSPSSEWAVYRFTAYRQGMSVVREIKAPRIEFKTAPDRCELTARCSRSAGSTRSRALGGGR
jgi:hypothetical protein